MQRGAGKICKHFQRGLCKFGDRCWFRHVIAPRKERQKTPEERKAASDRRWKRYEEEQKRYEEKVERDFERRFPDLSLYAPYKCKYPFATPQVVYTWHYVRARDKGAIVTFDGETFYDQKTDHQQEMDPDPTKYERRSHWKYSESFPHHPLGFVWKQLRARDAALDVLLKGDIFPKELGQIILSYAPHAEWEVKPIHILDDFGYN